MNGSLAFYRFWVSDSHYSEAHGMTHFLYSIYYIFTLEKVLSTINVPVVYMVRDFDAGKAITRAI
jgi:hypothetical protein